MELYSKAASIKGKTLELLLCYDGNRAEQLQHAPKQCKLHLRPTTSSLIKFKKTPKLLAQNLRSRVEEEATTMASFKVTQILEGAVKLASATLDSPSPYDTPSPSLASEKRGRWPPHQPNKSHPSPPTSIEFDPWR